jgi:hypothetical protein
VVTLLQHDDAAVRGAAAAALEALGPAAAKAVPGLSRLLFDRWAAEKNAAVREALMRLLEARLAMLGPAEMNELLPLLRHPDPAVIRKGLKVVQDRKEEAAAVSAEVGALLRHDDAAVRGAALAALAAVGPAAGKALPGMFEVLDQTPKSERTPLALTVAAIIDVKDGKSVERLLPVLVDGLRPESLRRHGARSEAQINGALRRMGQPAVDRILAILDPNTRGIEEINYRKNLYNALAGLGPQCRSKDNHEKLKDLRDQELTKKYPDVIAAAGRAVGAMAPPGR